MLGKQQAERAWLVLGDTERVTSVRSVICGRDQSFRESCLHVVALGSLDGVGKAFVVKPQRPRALPINHANQKHDL